MPGRGMADFHIYLCKNFAFLQHLNEKFCVHPSNPSSCFMPPPPLRKNCISSVPGKIILLILCCPLESPLAEIFILVAYLCNLQSNVIKISIFCAYLDCYVNINELCLALHHAYPFSCTNFGTGPSDK